MAQIYIPAPDFTIIPVGEPHAGHKYRANRRVKKRFDRQAQHMFFLIRSHNRGGGLSNMSDAAEHLARGWTHLHFAEVTYDLPALYISALGLRYGEAGKCPPGAHEAALPPRYSPTDVKHLLRPSESTASTLIDLIAVLIEQSKDPVKFAREGSRPERIQRYLGELGKCLFVDKGRQRNVLKR